MSTSSTPVDDAVLVARSSPLGLALATNKSARMPPHLALLDHHLLRIARGELKRLIVTLPPRHGKSTIISRYFPAWFLGTFPDRRVILCSYEADFAKQWGRAARLILEEYGQRVFGITVDPSSSAADRWQIHGREGGMQTAGVGGPITGKGADLFVVDDPIKNAEDAASDTIREKQWDWYQSTAYSRLEPGAAFVILLTRWHEDDLAGRLIQAMHDGGEAWERLDLPALAREDDPLGRGEGEALWPQRYDEDALATIKRTLGPYWFSALYQQTPTPDEGGLFKRAWFQRWRWNHDPDPLQGIVTLHRIDGSETRVLLGGGDTVKFCTVDVADSEKKTADYTVVSTWAATKERDLILLDRGRVRFEGTELPGLVQEAYARWRPVAVKVERNMYGRALIKELRRRGLPVQALTADLDKVTRAIPASLLYQAGKVFHPAHASWLDELEAELLTFPNGTHDDQVDTVSYAARALPDLPFMGRRRDEKRIRPVTAGLGTAGA